MLPLRIAARFLRTSRLQSVLIVAGIAVGIALQVFVGSLITSLQASLVATTVGSSPQITVTAAKQGDPVVFGQALRKTIGAQAGITTIVPVRTVPSIFARDTETAPLQLVGGDLAALDTIYKVSPAVYMGKARLGGGDILIGKQFSEKWGLLPGSTVQLVLPKGQRAQLIVSGVYDLGSAAVNERTAFVSSAFAGTVLGYSGDRYSEIDMQVADVFKSKTIAATLARSATLSGLTVTDWQAQNADLLTALRSQSSSSYMIQVFVLVAVALGIASTLAISAVQKTRQIGILKAMGLGDGRAGAIFLWQALLLGAGGTIAGILLGVGLIWLFSLAPLTFTIAPQPGFIAVSAAVGIVVALLSAVIPTRSTSRLDPIEVIQGG